MASNSKFRDTLKHGSDFIVDFSCLSCSEDGRNSDANNYCKDCSQCFCDLCIQSHNKLLKRHVVLSRNDIHQWPTSSNLVGPPSPVVRCDTHSDESLHVICMDHHQLCCKLCVSVGHKQCSSIKQISDVSKGFHACREFEELPKRVSEITDSLANARLARGANQKAFDKSGNDCLAQLKSFQKQFHNIFERLERCTVAEMEQKKKSIGSEIQADVDNINDVNGKLQKLIDAFKDGSETDEIVSFIRFTKCDEMFRNAHVLLQAVVNKGHIDISFEPNKAIKENMFSLESFGEVVCKVHDHLFEVVKTVLHNVRLVNDQKCCSISGMCGLQSGEILLADRGNSTLKLLSSSYEVIATCDVPAYPEDVCLTGQREAAVAVDNPCMTEIKEGNERHAILLVRVRSEKKEKMRSVELQHRCTGLAHHGGQLYIAAMNALYVYDMEKDQEKQLHSNPDLYTVFKCAVSPDGSRIFITNFAYNKLITLNKDGTKLTTLNHPEMSDIEAIHITAVGHMFVSCLEQGSVVQVVEKNGKLIVRTIAGKKDGLTSPKALLYNSIKNSLVIGQWEDNDIVELPLI